jgi:hypothetical protein
MIDFRYHLVSLVSVFLALAVGIVLGAGPLKETIGSTLTERVESLRQEKDSLRVQLDTSEAAAQHRDDYITALTPRVISGQLAGRSVAIVTLPGVDGDAVKPLQDSIAQSGGTVTGQVSIGDAWTDPNREADRVKVISDLVAALPPGSVPTSGSTQEVLAKLLANSLVGLGAGALGTQPSPSVTVLKALRSADLIGTKGNVAGLAGSALMLAPANPDGSDQKVKPTTAGPAQTAYLDLATALDRVGDGTVVTGPASAAIGEGLLAAIRKDDDIKEQISTVDNGLTPMGVLTAVLALREQLAGGSGAYGSGSDTKRLPADATGVTSTPTATK